MPLSVVRILDGTGRPGHGPGGCYKDIIQTKTLRAWADDISKWQWQRRTVLVYFDNDQKSAAQKTRDS